MDPQEQINRLQRLIDDPATSDAKGVAYINEKAAWIAKLPGKNLFYSCKALSICSAWLFSPHFLFFFFVFLPHVSYHTVAAAPGKWLILFVDFICSVSYSFY